MKEFIEKLEELKTISEPKNGMFSAGIQAAIDEAINFKCNNSIDLIHQNKMLVALLETIIVMPSATQSLSYPETIAKIKRLCEETLNNIKQ